MHETNENHPSPRCPKRCLRSSRDTIEAELFNLRSSHKGFVKSESLRITSPRNSDDGIGDDERSTRRRRWQRRNGEGSGLIERFREAARRTKVLELRLVGRRSWWPQIDGKRSRVAVLPSPTNVRLPLHSGMNNTKNNNDKWYKQSKQGKDHKLIVNFPTKRRGSSSSSCDDNQLNGIHKNKVSGYPKRFWQTKEKAEVANNDQTALQSEKGGSMRKGIFGRKGISQKVDGSTSLCETIATVKSEDMTVDLVTTKQGSITADETGVDEKKKKKRFPILAVTAATSVSSLGIAAAIILL